MTVAAFDFRIATQIYFGTNRVQDAGAVTKQLGCSRVLVVTDRGLAQTALPGRLTHILENAGVSWVLFGEVEPNPTVEMIDRGAQIYQQEKCEGIVAIGGGSSIDTAKGIGVVVRNGGSIRDYLGAFKVPTAPPPVVAIPTTAGTGSEVSSQISVKLPERGVKSAVRSFLVQPAAAIVDPSLLATLPRKVAAETALDTLTHLVEGYVSKGASPYTDILALEGIRLCGKYLERFVKDRSDPEAASYMALAANWGGIVISFARTGGAHALTRPIGHVSHGLVTAIVLPAVMRYNLETNPTKFARMAAALGKPSTGDVVRDAQAACRAVEELMAALEVPTRLRDLGIRSEDLPGFAELAYELDISRLNPRDLTRESMLQLLREAW